MFVLDCVPVFASTVTSVLHLVHTKPRPLRHAALTSPKRAG